MSNIQQNIHSQLSEIKEIGMNSENLAQMIAQDSWDEFEKELEIQTADGLHWDVASLISQSLKIQLGLSFEKACETYFYKQLRQISNQFTGEIAENLQKQNSINEWASLQTGMNITVRLDDDIEDVFKKSKPGLLSQLSRMLVNDTDYVMEHMDKDAAKDAQKLLNNFYQAREKFTQSLKQSAKQLIDKACFAYTQTLKASLADQAA